MRKFIPNIRLSIEGMQIASITTDEQGEYEYATEEDYLEQTLDIIIQKEGFERKNISYEIDKAEIVSDILLNELEKGTKEKTRIFGSLLMRWGDMNTQQRKIILARLWIMSSRKKVL
jgi:hypothetical protein